MMSCFEFNEYTLLLSPHPHPLIHSTVSDLSDFNSPAHFMVLLCTDSRKGCCHYSVRVAESLVTFVTHECTPGAVLILLHPGRPVHTDIAYVELTRQDGESFGLIIAGE